MATTFDDFLKEELKGPEFKKEWDLLQPERNMLVQMSPGILSFAEKYGTAINDPDLIRH